VSPARGAIWSYVAMLTLQPVWHGVLPALAGEPNWALALIATLPLLLPLRGILEENLRSMTWGSYLLVFYLMAGVMEAWSNPADRGAALFQTALALLYVICLLMLVRNLRRRG